MNNTPKDISLHVLSMIALYISSVSLIALLFQYVNLYFPDPLSPVYYSSVASTIRWSMAALIIIFPCYLAVMRMLNREYAASPEKRNLAVRKWLVHLTLFFGALVIAGDLVALVYNFLGGELTVRFLLKVAAVAAVIGSAVSYYWLDLKDRVSTFKLNIFFWGSALIVLLSVVGGFFTAGSPFKARLFRFDEQKVSDLQNLQYQILQYWIQKQILPQNLAALDNDITGYRAPLDPQTRNTYEYAITDTLSFELCADFNMASDKALRVAIDYAYPMMEPQNWEHEQGRQCFSRTIDPELYRNQLKQLY